MKITNYSPQNQPFLAKISTIFKPPKQIYGLGELPDQPLPSVAIVGSRKPTAYGKAMAQRLSYDLASRGVVIISGLALGIDALAHRGCLEAGGITLAVLGSGLNYITPTTNQALARRILANGGAILSEYEADRQVKPYQFLERNRIVAGLADAVIVVEAARRSGTLSTASHAINNGRTVFALPGHVTSPMSEGCNHLIQQGALLLTSAEEVLEELGLNQQQKSDKNIKLPISNDPLEQKIIDLIASGENSGDKIVEKLQIEPQEFNFSIQMLELKEVVKGVSNRWYLR